MDQLLVEVNEVDSTDKLSDRQFVRVVATWFLIQLTSDLWPLTSSMLDQWTPAQIPGAWPGWVDDGRSKLFTVEFAIDFQHSRLI